MSETLAEAVRRRRSAVGLTQGALAELAGVSVRTVRDIEHGRVRRPRPSVLHGLARALGVDGEEEAAFSAGWVPGAARGTQIAVLGPLTVRRGSAAVPLSSPNQRRLLGLLALQPQVTVSRDEVVAVLWDDRPPRTYASALHNYLTRLRRLLEVPTDRPARPRPLLASRHGYTLAVDADQLDLLRFRALDGKARAAEEAGEAAAARELFAGALACWCGPVLAGEDARLTGHPAAVALERRRLAAALGLADTAIHSGEPAAAVDRLLELAAREPRHEALHARLMLTLAAAGQPGEALAVFAALRTRLRQDLGIDPGAEVRQAHLQVLRQEPAVPVRAPHRPPHADAPAQLPPSVAEFIGRRAGLASLDKVWARHTRRRAAGPCVAVVVGTAGVGKTTLAGHWAHRVREEFPDGQLFVNLRGFDPAGSATTVSEAVQGFLAAFGVPPERVPAGVEAQISLYRGVLAGRRVLVVLDNARDAEQVRPLLPSSPGCAALVTSRHDLAGLVATEGAHPLSLDLLSPAEAREFLARRVGTARVRAEPGPVTDIVEACARLPLALAVVAARVRLHPLSTLDSLAGQLRSARDGIAAFTGDDALTDLRAVFSWSVRALSPAAARLFRLLGLHPGPDVSPLAAASLAGQPPDTARAQLTELAQAHLLTEHAGRYAAHDLLRAYAAGLVRDTEPEAERAAATHRLLDHYTHTAYRAARLLAPRRDPIDLDPALPEVTCAELVDQEAALEWYTTEHRVLLAAVELAAGAGLDTHTWRLAWAIADHLQRRGHWPEWAGTQTAALHACRRLGDRPGQARAHRAIAGALVYSRSHDDAEHHLIRAQRLYAGLGDHVGEAHTRLSLGRLEGWRGDDTAALRHSERALDLYRKGEHRSGEADALNAVGWFQAQLGRYPPALVSCQAALDVHLASGDQRGQADSLDSLGFIHHRAGRFDEAARCLRRAVALFEQLGDRYSGALSLTNLGDALDGAGRRADARSSWRAALAVFEELGHPDAGTVRAKLAS